MPVQFCAHPEHDFVVVGFSFHFVSFRFVSFRSHNVTQYKLVGSSTWYNGTCTVPIIHENICICIYNPYLSHIVNLFTIIIIYYCCSKKPERTISSFVIGIY